MLKNRITVILTALAFAFGVGLVGAPAASAGNCSAPGVCGRVVNESYYQTKIIRDYGTSDPWRWLSPGQRSWDYYADTDVVYIGSGACRIMERWTADGVWSYGRQYGPKNFKISDLFWGERWIIKNC
jgi:hypothetical protein